MLHLTTKVFRSGHHTINSKQNITKSPNFFSHQTLTLNTSQKINILAFSISLRVHLVKHTTTSSSKAPKPHVKIVTYIHYNNGVELLISVIFSMIPQLGGLGPKAQSLVMNFCLGEREYLPYFHLIYLAIRSGLVLMRFQTVQINILTGKYIMKLTNLKHLQCYVTSFDLDFRRFERKPQSNQLSIIFTPRMEIIF